MGKVNEVPSQEIIANVVKACHVVDGMGRKIHLRKPGVLAQYRLVEMLGDHAASNDRYMGMVAPLMYISQIDDDDAITITTKTELEALIQRLGEEGLDAVMAKVKEVYGGQQDPKATADGLKK